MSPHITMWSYVWDLLDDGIDDVLREMKNDIGLTSLSVATHYHSVEHLRPHTKGSFIYRDAGAFYFTPDLSRYTNTSMRPRISPLAQAGNPLRRISDRAADIGLNLVSWTLACHDSALGNAYPHATIENSMGDRYPEALCPANPEVRGFLVGMASDLTHNYRLKVLELESLEYPPGRHFHHHEKIAVPLGAADAFLSNLCFCPHCSKRAADRGVDVPRLRAWVAKTFREAFASGETTKASVAEVIAKGSGLRAFVDARIDAVSTLLADIKQASACTVSAITWADADVCGLDPVQAANTTGSITIAAYTPDADKARVAIRTASRNAGGVEKIRVGYHTYPPIAPDKETLLRVIAASLDEGVVAFSFYNYGIAPRRSLEWVRAATDLIRSRVRC